MASPCSHPARSQSHLEDRGEYGSRSGTDWTWCGVCGAVTNDDGKYWQLPQAAQIRKRRGN